MEWVPSTRTTSRMGNQSAYDSYGPKLQLPHVTGSRRIRLMVGKHGKQIGYRTSSECNSWLFGYPGGARSHQIEPLPYNRHVLTEEDKQRISAPRRPFGAGI